MQRPPVGQTVEVAAGGLCWLLSLEFFVGQAVAQAAWTGAPYTLVNNEVSDLGITVCETVKGQYLCSPLHTLMNASFILAGVLRPPRAGPHTLRMAEGAGDPSRTPVLRPRRPGEGDRRSGS